MFVSLVVTDLFYVYFGFLIKVDEKMVLKVVAAGETLFMLVLFTFLINLHCFVICFVFL